MVYDCHKPNPRINCEELAVAIADPEQPPVPPTHNKSWIGVYLFVLV